MKGAPQPFGVWSWLTGENLDKWSILAGLRFLLASIVAINHLPNFVPLGWMDCIPKFGAFEAILGFLLISGYSISISYSKQPEGFLIRRLKRLYPVYLTGLAASCLAGMLFEKTTPQFGEIAVNALFLNQLVTTTSLVGPAWSLSLELWLYCFAPLLAKLNSAHTRALIYFSFACYLIYTALRTLMHLPYYSGIGFGANLLLLSFAWIAGLRLARMGDRPASAMRDLQILFGGHIVLAAGIQFMARAKHHAIGDFFRADVVDFAFKSATLLLVYLIFTNRVITTRAVVRRSSLLRFLGDVSYPLYILHMATYRFVLQIGIKDPLWFYLIAVAFSALVCQTLDFYTKQRHQKVGTT